VAIYAGSAENIGRRLKINCASCASLPLQGLVIRSTSTMKQDPQTTGPSFLAMFRQRKFDVLLFWALDRLSREAKTLFLNRLTACGVLPDFTEQYFDSCGAFKDAVTIVLRSPNKSVFTFLNGFELVWLARAKGRCWEGESRGG
jgi:hypothetical protein